MKYTPGRQHREKPASRAVKKFSGLRKCPEIFFTFRFAPPLTLSALCAQGGQPKSPQPISARPTTLILGGYSYEADD